MGLTHAITDALFERFDPHYLVDDEHYDWYAETIEKPVLALLCAVYGHEPVRDQCGIPDHDHCAWCADQMPGAASAEQPITAQEGSDE